MHVFLSAGILVVCSIVSSARLHAQTHAAGPAAPIPRSEVTVNGIPAVTASPTIQVTPALQKVLQRVLQRSPAFRSQWTRISSAPNIQVVVRFPKVSETLHDRAMTRFVRSPERLNATVILNPSADAVEATAHELEHVIEQLEGIDYARLSQTRGGGVSRLEAGYETDRAMRAGEQVHREYLHGWFRLSR